MKSDTYSVHYCYPTSQLASELGQYSKGCFFIEHRISDGRIRRYVMSSAKAADVVCADMIAKDSNGLRGNNCLTQTAGWHH